MSARRFFRFHLNPWLNGLWLALLNLVVAGFVVVSFAGGLWLISMLNQFTRSQAGGRATEIPFPYPVLMALDAVACVVVWLCFGRRLPSGGKARLVTALVGAAPLFAASLTGYLGALAALLANEWRPRTMGAAPVVVSGGLATLMLIAAMACVLLVLWTGGAARDRRRARSTGWPD